MPEHYIKLIARHGQCNTTVCLCVRVCVCVSQTRAELVASRTLVEQLESRLQLTSSEIKERDIELRVVTESRDDAVRENERLTAKLQRCHSNHTREVNTLPYLVVYRPFLRHTHVWGKIHVYGAKYTCMGQNTRVWGKIHVYGAKYTCIGQNTRVWGKIHMYGAKYTCIGQNTHVWGKIHMYGAKYTCMGQNTHVSVSYTHLTLPTILRV